jgi:hypothetical protein
MMRVGLGLLALSFVQLMQSNVSIADAGNDEVDTGKQRYN